MIYILGIIFLVIIIIAVLIWYFVFHKTKKPVKPVVPAYAPVSYAPKVRTLKPLLPKVSSPPISNPSFVDRNNGISQSSYFSPITVDEPSVVDTEQKLLKMARAPIPHPQMVFSSNLRNNGNPFIGDLIIKPRNSGVSIPLNDSPNELQVGYFGTAY